MLGWLRLSIGLLEIGLLFVRFYNGPVSRCTADPFSSTFPHHISPTPPIFRVCNDEVTACIPYGGVWVTSTFTIWCWILQSLFFIASGLITLNKHHWGKPSQRMIFALWVSYEVSLCVAVLVVTAVWLVLIPVLDWKLASFSGSQEVRSRTAVVCIDAKRKSASWHAVISLYIYLPIYIYIYTPIAIYLSIFPPLSPPRLDIHSTSQALAALKLRKLAMQQPFAVLVHTANLWFLLLEHALNSLPFNNAHFPFVLLWGCTYVGFAWVWYNLTGIWCSPCSPHPSLSRVCVNLSVPKCSFFADLCQNASTSANSW